MELYIDITLRADAEIPINRLLNTVYTSFHKALCDLNSTTIGVSFPRYQITLGNLMRIHGVLSDLNDLQRLDWLGGMRAYCEVSEIKLVPDTVQFRTIKRKQTTMSQAKLKRLVKRGSITENELKQYKAKMFTKGLEHPYLELISGSNGHKHRRYIEFGELIDHSVTGQFDQFGLSKTATVPWF